MQHLRNGIAQGSENLGEYLDGHGIIFVTILWKNSKCYSFFVFAKSSPMIIFVIAFRIYSSSNGLPPPIPGFFLFEGYVFPSCTRFFHVCSHHQTSGPQRHWSPLNHVQNIFTLSFGTRKFNSGANIIANFLPISRWCSVSTCQKTALL